MSVAALIITLRCSGGLQQQVLLLKAGYVVHV